MDPSSPPRYRRPTRAAADPRQQAARQAAIALLRAHGLAVTPQRLLLVEIARAMPDHFTARAIYERMRQTYPALSLVTVYRGLETLRELGLVTRTDLGNAIEQYEWADRGRHHHLICLSCGRQQAMDDAELNVLRAQLLDRHAFHAAMDHQAIFGLCAACAARQKGEDATTDTQM